MGWWDSFINAVKDFFAWLGSEETQESIKNILSMVLIIVNTMDRLNAPLDNRQKPAAVRTVVDFLKYMTPAQRNVFVNLVQNTNFWRIPSHELDAMIGMTIAEHIKNKKGPPIHPDDNPIPDY